MISSYARYKRSIFLPLFLCATLLFAGCVALEPEPVVVPDDEVVEPEVVDPDLDTAIDPAVDPGLAPGIGVAGAVGGSMLWTELEDEDIETPLGDDLGEIENLLIDWSTGDVLFASVEHGGFLDIGDIDLPAPLGAMAWDPIDGDFILDIPEEVFETFPEVDDGWEPTFFAQWRDPIATFWTDAGYDVTVLAGADETSVVWATDVVDYGIDAYNVAGLGNVSDLVIDLDDASVQYVVLGFLDVGVYGPDARLVPYSAFEPVLTPGGATLVLTEDIDAELLVGAPAVSTVDLYAYDTFDPAWVTPFDQYWTDTGVLVPQETDDQPADEPAMVATGTPAPEEAPAEAVEEAINAVEVELISFEILMPETLPVGITEFSITNTGEVEHNFAIEGQGLDYALEQTLQPGESALLQVDLVPGTYRVYCPVGDHAAQGMELTLTVTE